MNTICFSVSLFLFLSINFSNNFKSFFSVLFLFFVGVAEVDKILNITFNTLVRCFIGILLFSMNESKSFSFKFSYNVEKSCFFFIGEA